MSKHDKKIVFSLAMIIIPWLSVPFMGKNSFFRFLPVACFTDLSISLFSVFGNKKKWWVNKNPLSPGLVDFTYILGPFFVATLWIFKLTYGKFPKYLITNIVLDVINAYPFAQIWENIGIFKLKKMTHTIWYFLCVGFAIVIYGFQYIIEKSIRKASSPVAESGRINE
jgi:hypothetical protein